MSADILEIQGTDKLSLMERFRRLGKGLKYRLQRWGILPKPEGNYIKHAKREFLAVGYIPLDVEQEEGPNKWIQENIFELLRVFEAQGHSGTSAPYCIAMFKKLASFEPLCPLTGENSEWNEVGSGMFQNNRCSHVFKDADGKAYDIEGRIFREPNGSCYTGSGSWVYIEFPYVPKKEYVDVGGDGTPIGV